MRVHDVREDAQRAQTEWEAVDEDEEDLHGDDGVDQARQQLLREDSVLLDEFGEVVEAGCCMRRVKVSYDDSRKRSLKLSGREQRWSAWWRGALTDC